ncbi:Cys-tRNA(Pro)/Cys-tRNA(Cys) deacylase [Enterococcus florum]|uniref:Cys-tRNA(Pro)/Cys-tRNA(Cys) deacylase n=1 Tax=Enterococcus florum TaxID=2480627 RepID=A0A4P5PCV9_9ENTE|nr:YbaK/EbsC family protein [Enterococcus florum]GCF93322.1 Cys-tRNA(Pro)/Cys-tRNA(Cys) deacylase [Enterococcus florum]
MSNQVETFLEERGIPFQTQELPAASENGRAELAKMPEVEKKIFKTLVLKGDKTGVIVALVPLEGRLDYKKVAKATGNRKVGLPPMDFVLAYTGYEHGANTPIGIHLKHPEYPQLADQSIQSFDTVVVSSGELGRAVELSVSDLKKVVQPQLVDLLK